MKKTFLMTRKINKQEYKFYHMDFTKEESFTDEPHGCFIVETPKNAFGYSDVVYFDRRYIILIFKYNSKICAL